MSWCRCSEPSLRTDNSERGDILRAKIWKEHCARREAEKQAALAQVVERFPEEEEVEISKFSGGTII